MSRLAITNTTALNKNLYFIKMIFACIRAPPTYVQLDILFCQITTFINVRVVIVFGLQTL